MKTILLLCLTFIACHSQQKTNTKVTYTKELLPRKGIKLELLQQLLLKDIAVTGVLYFNEAESQVTEMNSDFNFRSPMTIIKSSNDSLSKCYKSFPYLNFWYKAERFHESIKSVPDIVTFSSETKSILGHSCKRVTIETEYYRYIIWYAPDLKLADQTRTIPQFESVLGAVLEMNQFWTDNKMKLFRHFKITSIEQNTRDKGLYEIPEGFLEMKDTDAAESANWENMLKATQNENYPETEKQKFIGNWILKAGKDRIKVIIERRPDGSYSLSEIQTYQGEEQPYQTFPAEFHGRRLLAKDSPNYHTYYLTEDGKLKKEFGDFYIFTRQ